jgi:hypothetical protein
MNWRRTDFFWTALKMGEPFNVKAQILAALLFEFRQLGQSTFAGLPRAVDQNGRRVSQCLKKLLGQVTTNHGCIINHYLAE